MPTRVDGSRCTGGGRSSASACAIDGDDGGRIVGPTGSCTASSTRTSELTPVVFVVDSLEMFSAIGEVGFESVAPSLWEFPE